MTYRPEIDGLRAVAVLPVIFFHAHLGPFQGGFIGVDIFFVISGYLITSLLLLDIASNRFSLISFYERRARRILPALFFVILACMPFAYLWMFPLALNDFFQSVFATTVFSSNILFWLETGYFSPASDLKPLLHTWSLAIEEQFYILFPLLLIALMRGPAGLRRTTVVLAALTFASFMLAMGGTFRWPDANFYLLPGRAWELLAGCFCAIALRHQDIKPNASLGFLGLTLIGAGLIWCSDALWPSWMTLLPVIGTVLIILFTHAQNGCGRLLAARPMVGIGLISYSAYLWHQPLLAFVRLRKVEPPTDAQMILVVITTLMLAYLTWRFVERPFRITSQPPVFARRTIFTTSGTVGAVLIGVALIGDATDGFPDRIAPSGRHFAQIGTTIADNRLPCDTDITITTIPLAPLSNCQFQTTNAGPQGAKRAILIGDSHATVMAQTIRDAALRQGFDIAVMTFGGCVPFPGISLIGRDCNTANEAVYAHIEQATYDLVIIAARPQYLIADEVPSTFFAAQEGTHAQKVLNLINTGLARLQATQSQIIYIEPVPEMPIHIGDLIRKSYAFVPEIADIAFTQSYAAYHARSAGVMAALDHPANADIIRVHTGRVLCNAQADTCLGAVDGQALYTDDNHLSARGSTLLVPALDHAIAQASRPIYLAGRP